MCVFCDILAGKIACSMVHENENVCAFLDISPVNYGHTLVVPRKHYENMHEIPEEVLMDVIKVVKKVAQSLKDNLDIQGFNIFQNNGIVAGQVVPHLHFHVIPRNDKDGLKHWTGGRYGDGDELEILNKIKF